MSNRYRQHKPIRLLVREDARVRVCACVRVCVCVNDCEYRVVTKLEYGEEKVGRFFVALTAMDIINRDRVRTGML